MSQALLEKRLIACANLYDNVTSLYRWQGGIQQEQEVTIMAKTNAAKVAGAIEFIKSTHSYQLPCVTAHPLADGSAPFLQWVEDETAG